GGGTRGRGVALDARASGAGSVDRAVGERPGAGRCRTRPARGRRARPVRVMVGQIPVAFLRGVVSFIAPCVLPLVPGYLSAVSAVEAGRLGEPGTTKRVFLASLPFVAGFTVLFVALGAGAGLVGNAVSLNSTKVQAVAGFIVVVFGLAFVGLLP